MTTEERAKLIQVAATIVMDAENDARNIDGPCDGKKLARLFGQQLAMIQALAGICKRILESGACASAE